MMAFNYRNFFTLAAAGLFTAGLAGPAHAETVYEVDDKDSSATPFGNTCFSSTFRILYQGDDYTACASGLFSGILWNLGVGPRALGQPPFRYDNNGLHCLYAKWADGAARWTNVQYEVDWSSFGAFAPDIRYFVNQQRDGGQWVRLGCSTLPIAGQFPIVRCSNAGVPAGRFAICDGIKVVRENVDGGDIIDGTVQSVDIQNGTITGIDIATNSVPSTDLSNEAGLDWTNAGSCSNIGTTVRNCASVTVSAPSSGWALVQCKGFAVTFGANTVVELGVSTSPLSIGEYNRAGILDGTDTIRRTFPLSTFAVFAIPSSGSFTYYCNALKESVFDAQLVNIGDVYISATFFPTRY